MTPSIDNEGKSIPAEDDPPRPDICALRIWLVPHTHWDREWYLPFERFRIHLARLMDDLIDALESDPALVFTLDGQTVLLDDYLEIRPEQGERLRRLIVAGRIAIGPSYVLPDEFLSTQETLIRNLLVGRQTSLRHGGVPMRVAYAPDTFGHIAQMPQILRGFGIDSFVFWRGLGDEADRLGAVFWWQAPDGSRVLAVRLLEGYANARDLGRWTRKGGWVSDNPQAWPGTSANRIGEFVQRWLPTVLRSGIQDLLLGNGVDHQPIQRDLPLMIGACQLSFPEASFRIGTYQDYVDALPRCDERLQTHSGELVGGREACVVRGVNSTRLYLKQANEAAERAILVAEVLATLAYLRGCRVQRTAALAGADAAQPSYPLNELRLAWRELLRNQPHDSLPGCSLDEVHRDMVQRYRVAQQIAVEVQRGALGALAGHVPSLRPWEDGLVNRSAVNPLPWRRTGLLELELPDQLRSSRRLRVETPRGDRPVQVMGPPDDRRALVVADVDGFGAQQLRLSRGTATAPFRSARAVGCNTIENDYYRVAVDSNGGLVVTDVRTDERWSGLHWFEDEADRGDEYSYCPVDDDEPWDSRNMSARTRVLAQGPLVAELEITLQVHLAKALNSDRKGRAARTVSCPIRTMVRLTAGIDRIEFRTTVLNRARDHRLRVLFSAPESQPFVRVEGHFAVLRRPAQPNWNGQWREPPAKTHHTLGAVAAGRLLILSRGLPEYEAVPNPDGGVSLALTLLRCVGWLSCADLSTRPGAEEPHIPTPDAQCLGEHSFEYAISFRGDAPEWELVRASQDYRIGLVAGPAGADPECSLVVNGSGFGFSALKGADDGRGAILRLYNPGSAPAVAEIGTEMPEVVRCRLDETRAGRDRNGVVVLRPGEIATVRIAPTPLAGAFGLESAP